MGKIKKLICIIISVLLTNCAYTPPNLEYIQRAPSDARDATAFKTVASGGIRYNQEFKYQDLYEGQLREKKIGGDCILSFNYSKKVENFAFGAGISNANLVVTSSFIIPLYASVSPYIVLGADYLTPGVMVSITPIEYVGFKGAVFKECIYSDMYGSGYYVPNGLNKQGSFSVYEGSIFGKLYSHRQGNTISSFIIEAGVKAQLEYNEPTLFASLNVTSF